MHTVYTVRRFVQCVESITLGKPTKNVETFFVSTVPNPKKWNVYGAATGSCGGIDL